MTTIEIKATSHEFKKGHNEALRTVRMWLKDNKDRPCSDLLALLEQSEKLAKLLME